MSDFVFPARRAHARMVSSAMREAQQRTVQVLNDSGLVVWTGPSRQGKTTTATWMRDEINQAYGPDNPDAFKAHYYEVGEIPDTFQDGGKKAIRGMYHSSLGRLDEGTYRGLMPEQLAAQLVHGLALRNIELVFVDEAGLLSLKAIRGLVLVRDTAHNAGQRLTIVFIGMDDLPEKLNIDEQVKNRVQEWVFFDEFTLEETSELMCLLHPPFAEKSLKDEGTRECVEWVHEKCSGRPGLVVALIQKAVPLAEQEGTELNLTLIRAARLLTQRDRKAALDRGRPQAVTTK